MWWRKLSLLAVSACFVLALGCGNTTGDDDDDDDDNNTVTPSDSPSESPSPTPLQMFDLTFTADGGSFAGPHTGRTVGIRIVDSQGAEVVGTCDNTVVMVAGQDEVYTFVDALTEGESYTVELWMGDPGAADNNTYEMADHEWSYTDTSPANNAQAGLANVAADVTFTGTHNDNQVGGALPYWGIGDGC